MSTVRKSAGGKQEEEIVFLLKSYSVLTRFYTEHLGPGIAGNSIESKWVCVCVSVCIAGEGGRVVSASVMS
ncbi:hypothetical protein EXN66_Car008513 [Channa argus]|uniref:Uncharacterized protein n=1 Tax=Channa argus TaxID=215402 RepID=A0A6G1PRI7_CHAAH|nr:hypothetical protein EXN66_Car008513 [Channa argus]